jgi:hypothetical protein
MSYCCEKCFAHPWLKRFVKENSTISGHCYYCSDDEPEDGDPEDEDYEPLAEVALLNVDALSEYFHRLLSMYTIPETYIWEKGEPLIWRVQWDWGVFDEDS